MSWVDTIRANLHQRDTIEKQHASLIEHFNRLASLTHTLKQRNAALLHAASSAPPVSTSNHAQPSARAGSSGKGEVNAVQQAYLTSLESQLASTRQELSEQYKQSSVLSQRLVLASDELHRLQSREREEKDELNKLKGEVEALRERQRWHKEVVQEKEKQLLILQDDHASLSLELSQTELKNEHLTHDNAALLQRWIEAKNEEAARMNEANAFLQEAEAAKIKAQMELAQNTAAGGGGSGGGAGDS